MKMNRERRFEIEGKGRGLSMIWNAKEKRWGIVELRNRVSSERKCE